MCFCLQTEGPPCPVPWISPESPARPHLAVIGLDAHLWYHSPQGPQRGWLEPAGRGRGASGGCCHS